MRTEIINTGSELLLGLVTNTHLGHLAGELAPFGITIERQCCVPDGPAIRNALDEALGRADIVITTGGLGPTTDDLTREAAAELLGLEMQNDEEILAAIRGRFVRRSLPMASRVARQAMVPQGAVPLPNPHGTAPGLYFGPGLLGSRPAQHLFLLPGPPRELHPMVADHVLPILREKIRTPSTKERRIYRLTGIGESHVEELVGPQLESQPGLEIGYCARPSEVDLRLIGTPDTLAAADPVVREALGEWIYSGGPELEETVVGLLRKERLTLATAESCTGGGLANRVTDVPGASEIFLAGFVTYSNAAKHNELGVPEDLLEKHGAVSEPVAAAMAEGARSAAGTDFAVSTTGIAGPGGGTPEKPAGTVFIALAGKDHPTVVRRCYFPLDRVTFKHMTASAALDLLRRRLLGLPLDPEHASAQPKLG